MNKSDKLKILAGMPAYNEANYIGSLVLQVRQYVDDVIIVDDGSTDDTAKIADLAGAYVVQHEKNRGYGGAIRSLLAEAKNQDADILVILDADTQHKPEEIPSLIKGITEGSDIVIGSRDTQREKIATYRRFGQKVLSKMTNISSRQKLTDTESGFRAYSRKALNTLELKEEGMAVSSEIVSEAANKGLQITEVPISVIYTRDGSTLNPISHGLGVLNRIIVMISERRPLLFFGIIGLMFIISGIVIGVLVVQTLTNQQILQVGSALVSMLLITIGVLGISTGLILSVLIRRLKDHL
jgi:glycosyltransferase involved in cell wall biosynthesis